MKVYSTLTFCSAEIWYFIRAYGHFFFFLEFIRHYSIEIKNEMKGGFYLRIKL